MLQNIRKYKGEILLFLFLVFSLFAPLFSPGTITFGEGDSERLYRLLYLPYWLAGVLCAGFVFLLSGVRAYAAKLFPLLLSLPGFLLLLFRGSHICGPLSETGKQQLGVLSVFYRARFLEPRQGLEIPFTPSFGPFAEFVFGFLLVLSVFSLFSYLRGREERPRFHWYMAVFLLLPVLVGFIDRAAYELFYQGQNLLISISGKQEHTWGIFLAASSLFLYFWGTVLVSCFILRPYPLAKWCSIPTIVFSLAFVSWILYTPLLFRNFPNIMQIWSGRVFQVLGFESFLLYILSGSLCGIAIRSLLQQKRA